MRATKEDVKRVLDDLHDSDLSDGQLMSEASRELHLPIWEIVEAISLDPAFFGYERARQ